MVDTKWHNLQIYNGKGKNIPDPNLADVIYHVFRGCNVHSEAVPKNYEILPMTDGLSKWFLAKDVLRMPERIICALLTESIFAKVNADIKLLILHTILLGKAKPLD